MLHSKLKNSYLLTSILLLIATKLTPSWGKHLFQSPQQQQHQPLITNLEPIVLNEEQPYENFLVYNFNPHLAASSTFRLELLASSPKTITTTTSSMNRTTTTTTSLLTKFRLVDSTYLHLSGIFDREALLEQNECDLNDETSTSSCLIRLKFALYNNESQLVNLFVLPIAIADINDQRPKFKSNVYYLNVSENLPARTTLPLEVPTDADSDKFSVRECHLVGSPLIVQDFNLFDVNFSQLAKSLHLVVNAPLDRENRSAYNLTLVCSDGRFKARTQLQLDVLDANDNMPVILGASKMNVSVFERRQVGERIVRVEASDLDDARGPNGRLVYSLPGELNDNELRRLFEIEEETGWVELKEALDYEKARRHVLKVKVEDRGANSVPAYVEISITVLDSNDNAPQCHITYSDSYLIAENRSNQTIWIQEEMTANSSIPINLAYLSITDMDSPLSNGQSLSATLISIKYINASTLELQSENTTITSASFRLNPIILQYGNYYYALQVTNRLDCEAVLYYDLVIRLNDNSQEEQEEGSVPKNQLSSDFKLRVILTDVNDNSPVFKQTQVVANEHGQVQFEYFKFTVPENQLILNFATVQAIDLDKSQTSRLEFRILDENNLDLINLYSKYLTKSETLMNRNRFENDLNPNYLFFINSENGTLSLRAELDRERKEVYVFTVRVNDSEHVSEVLVEVTLGDINDNQPVYQAEWVEFELDENVAENSFVGNVRALDPDLDPTTEYFVEPYEMTRLFYVEPESGNLMTKISLDAEDLELVLLQTENNTFKMVVYARDPYFANSSSVDLRQMSKLNVSVRLRDVNDNLPQVVNMENSLLPFDLSKYAGSSVGASNSQNSSCPNMNLNLKTIETVDADRDTKNRAHLYKFAYIRRLSWQFVHEIVKSELNSNLIKNISSSSRRISNNNQSVTTSLIAHELLKFIESLILVQNKYEIKPVTKVNLRSVFWLDQQSDRPIANQVNVTLNQLCKLNWGVYNLSVQINEDSLPSLSSDYSFKLFVFNSAYNTDELTNMTSRHFELLNSLIENWWSLNSHLIVSLKRRLDSISNNSTQTTLNASPNSKPAADDNGDYIDGITQEYYKFYASSAFSKFNANRNGHGSNGFFDLTHLIIFNSTSNSIILLITAFLLVSIGLILIISYKHYKASNSTNEFKKHLGKKQVGNKKQTTFVNIGLSKEKSDSSINASSDISTAKQSTKDLSASPNLAASKFGNKKLMGLKTSQSTTSSTSSSSSSNLILYPSQHQQQHQQQQQQLHQKYKQNLISSVSSTSNINPSNEQATRYVKCVGLEQNPSICDSFTVITSLTAATGENLCSTTTAATTRNLNRHQPISESSTSTTSSSSSSSSTSSSSTTSSSTSSAIATPVGTATTTVYLTNATSTPTVLSTFSPLPISSSTSTPPGVPKSNKTNDQGYYGSSDYSENNSFARQSSIQHSDIYLRQIKQSRGQPNTFQSTQPKLVQQQQQQQTNSSSSFASSLLSSPSSSTDSSDFLQQQQQQIKHQSSNNNNNNTNSTKPTITNMYPVNVYQANFSNTKKLLGPSGAEQSTDVKVYLEKFERIYNSESPSNGGGNNGGESKALSQMNTFNSNLNNKQRNSMTTYSYV